MIAQILTRKALFLLVLGLFSTSSFAADGKKTKAFDHSVTGFDLEGVHRTLACADCHIDGKFKGTPRDCFGCHSLNGLSNASTRSAAHIQTTQDCAACHLTTIWEEMFRVDHTQVLGSCASCHQDAGIVATGRSDANFVHTANTTLTCNACHSTLAWVPINILDHNETQPPLGGASCQACHGDGAANVGITTGAPADHLERSGFPAAGCNTCHQDVTRWCNTSIPAASTANPQCP